MEMQIMRWSCRRGGFNASFFGHNGDEVTDFPHQVGTYR